MQDIECTIKDHNLNTDETLQLVKEFSKGCARNNINFHLKVMDRTSVEGLFENLRQVFSSGEDRQQMLAKFYSCTQNPKESVKESRSRSSLDFFTFVYSKSKCCKMMSSNGAK